MSAERLQALIQCRRCKTPTWQVREGHFMTDGMTCEVYMCMCGERRVYGNNKLEPGEYDPMVAYIEGWSWLPGRDYNSLSGLVRT